MCGGGNKGGAVLVWNEEEAKNGSYLRLRLSWEGEPCRRETRDGILQSRLTMWQIRRGGGRGNGSAGSNYR